MRYGNGWRTERHARGATCKILRAPDAPGTRTCRCYRRQLLGRIMLKAIGWIIFIIFLIGLLVVLGVGKMIF